MSENTHDQTEDAFSDAKFFQPGDRVMLVGHENWGVGAVQSAIGDRITVNFEDAGKQTISLRHASLRRITQ